MSNINAGVDLHIHTVASDGVLTPTQVVEKAYSNKLKAIAITDHDTIDGVTEAIEVAKQYGIEIVSGAEFTTNHKPVVHILGLGIDIKDKRLIAHFNQLEKSKLFLLTKAIRFLRKDGVDIDVRKIQEEMKTVTILNIKNYLLEHGLDTEGDERDSKLQNIIDEWIEGTPSPQECIKLIHLCGGKAILAHPIHLFRDRDALKAVISEFRVWGLDGIEINHPDHLDADKRIFEKWASEMHLLCSGGSDFHGVNGRDDVASGNSDDDSFVPYIYLEEMRGKKSAECAVDSFC